MLALIHEQTSGIIFRFVLSIAGTIAVAVLFMTRMVVRRYP